MKVAEEGTETMVKLPLKLASETLAMVTLPPGAKPCAAVVVMVTMEPVVIVAVAAPEVAVPPLLEALGPDCAKVKETVEGREAMVKVPLKLASATPEMVTL